MDSQNIRQNSNTHSSSNKDNPSGNNNQNQGFWRKCSSCKKEIPFQEEYYICSVSTCSQRNTDYVFCSMTCFDRHVPVERHKNAAAITKIAPSSARSGSSAVDSVQNSLGLDIREKVSVQRSGGGMAGSAPRDILIVASKLKEYIRFISDMNTSAEVMDILSDMIRLECERAVQKAKNDGRKTVMARDFRS